MHILPLKQGSLKLFSLCLFFPGLKVLSVEKVTVRENWLACAQYCALLEKLDFVSEITSVME